MLSSAFSSSDMESLLSSGSLAVDSLFNEYPRTAEISPLNGFFKEENFVSKDERVLVEISERVKDKIKEMTDPCSYSFELAGPRKELYWKPLEVKVAIVTCGGVAPGLNKVIQSVVSCFYETYGVREIFGVPFGYRGFSKKDGSFEFKWEKLSPEDVQSIDFEAGSVLGAGRGYSDPKVIVDALQEKKINILITIGGDGTLRGAKQIYEEAKKRNLVLGLIGIPKTIDNDVMWVSKTFGFGSALGKAAEALIAARAEARSAYHGAGLVKIMGRHSGTLTAAASLAVHDVDFVIIPEIPLVLEGEQGFLNQFVHRLVTKGHVTVALAEGAGQHLFPKTVVKYDESGNVKLQDIGVLVRDRIKSYCREQGVEINLKYLDPSYYLRAQTTSAEDSIFCTALGQHAVHAAMAGKTGCFIGYAHECFTHAPFHSLLVKTKYLDIGSPLWLSVLSATGQPREWI